MEVVFDIFFCRGSLLGNYNNCHHKDLERTFWSVGNMVDLRKTEGPRELCYKKKWPIEIPQTQLDVAKAINSTWQSLTVIDLCLLLRGFLSLDKSNETFQPRCCEGNHIVEAAFALKMRHPSEQNQEEATTATSFSKSVKSLYSLFFPGKRSLHSSSYPQDWRYRSVM